MGDLVAVYCKIAQGLYDKRHVRLIIKPVCDKKALGFCVLIKLVKTCPLAVLSLAGIIAAVFVYRA